MKKRLFCVALALVMLFAAVPTAAAASLENFEKVNDYIPGTFTDVPESEWYAEYVQLAYELGLVKGVSRTSFHPNGNITIAEAIALACRLHSTYMGNEEAFVQGSVWYQVYMDYAQANAIIDETRFADPNVTATRAQFAAIFAAALPKEALKAINNIRYGDIPDVDGSSADANAIYLLYKAGVLTGSDKYGTFHPKSNITRSEVSAIVTRMADESLRQRFSPVTEPAVSDKEDLSAWEELTEDDRVNFDTFKLLHADAMDYVNAAQAQQEALDGAEEISYETAGLCYEYLAACYEYFTVLSLNCEGYDYMANAKELSDMAASTIDPFLELELPEPGTDPTYFLTHYEDCVDTVSTIASYLSDEVTLLSETLFA